MPKETQKENMQPDMDPKALANVESFLDGKLFGRMTREIAFYLFLLIVATVVRTVDLTSMPLHHDESIHAKFFHTLLNTGEYRYDTVYHGPLFYYYNTLIYFLFGDSDFTARIGTVITGLILIALTFAFRPFIGRWAALLWATLLTISPTYIYFSRFVRHDMYVAAIVAAGFLYILKFIRDRKPGQAYMVFLMAALLFVTKEDSYIIAFIFVSFPILFYTFALFTSPKSDAVIQWRGFSRDFFSTQIRTLVIGFIIFGVVWTVFFTAFFQHPEDWNALKTAVTYWWGQHSIQRVAGRWFYYVPRLAMYECLMAFAVLYWVFVRSRSLIIKGFGYAVVGSMFLYTIAEMARIGGTVGAESLTKMFLWVGVVIGIAAALYAVILTVKGRISGTLGFVSYWSILAFMIYSWAGEKVPWLMVPIALPLSLLTAIILARGLGAWWTGTNRTVLPWVFAILAIYTLYSDVLLNFVYPAFKPKEDPKHRHAELMVYVQSTTDNQDMAAEIRRVLSHYPKDSGVSVAIAGQGVWPLSWYVRDEPVFWAQPEGEIKFPLIIVDPEVATEMSAAMQDAYEERRFQVRAWWVPEMYNPTEKRWVSIWKVFRYILTREVFSGIGSSDAVAFIQKDLDKTVAVTVNPPPPPMSYEDKKLVKLDPVDIWGGFGSPQGQFNEPRDIAVSSDGMIVIADSKNHRMVTLTREGRPLHTWGSEGSEPGKFKDPGGVTVDHGGNIYVADTWNHRIQKFTRDGQFVDQWGGKNFGFWGPRGVAVSKSGKIYVTDTGNKRVVVLSPEGKMVKTWGGQGSKTGNFIEPVGIVIDDGGTVFVADTGNHRIQAFDLDGQFLREFRVAGWTEFYTEPYIDLDKKHRIVVTDSSANRAARYLADGTLDMFWGKPGTGRGDFKGIIGIAVGPDGLVYISDTRNNRIVIYRLP